ncbi:MAG TPA: hypothetical protein DEB40_03895 [Elusimicrobia bacterium]|nr:hypothetical protein [Elusimicrobiota bacterium]HBT60869.1 hypothetical protein [Elusimicrobiota bacterium]
MITSAALHLGGLFLYLQMSQLAPKSAPRIISDVDLLIQTRKALPVPQAAAKPKTTTMDFLKMALPSIPKVEPRRMEVKLPEIKRPLMPQASRLDDRGRMREAAKIEALDLSRRRAAEARIEAKIESKRAATALAALPRLEEVGTRRVRNLPAAIALEERRQEAVALRAIQQLEVSPSSRRSAGPAEVLREANPPERSQLGEKIAAFLPAASERIEFQPRAAEPPTIVKKLESSAPVAPRLSASALGEKKKGVEIEGPLANRRVVSYDIPVFPEWAQQQGIIEAAVSIRFYVNREGEVMPEMRVENTSGYGRLDRLAMESLRRWKFIPIAANERQWGIITFRFLLE